MASPGDLYQSIRHEENQNAFEQFAQSIDTGITPPPDVSTEPEGDDIGALDIAAFMLSPFAAPADALQSIVATSMEGELDTVSEAFSIPALAFFDALLPGVRTAITENTPLDVGRSNRALGVHPDYGRRIAEQMDLRSKAGMTEEAKTLLGSSLEILMDPTIVLGIGALRQLANAPRHAQIAAMSGEGVWTAGVKDLMGTMDSRLRNVAGGTGVPAGHAIQSGVSPDSQRQLEMGPDALSTREMLAADMELEKGQKYSQEVEELFDLADKMDAGDQKAAAIFDEKMSTGLGQELVRMKVESESAKVNKELNAVLGDVNNGSVIQGLKEGGMSLPGKIIERVFKSVGGIMDKALKSDSTIEDVVSQTTDEAGRTLIRQRLEAEATRRQANSLGSNIAVSVPVKNHTQINNAADVISYSERVDAELSKTRATLFEEDATSIPWDIDSPTFTMWYKDADLKDELGKPVSFYTSDDIMLYPERGGAMGYEDFDKVRHQFVDGSYIKKTMVHETYYDVVRDDVYEQMRADAAQGFNTKHWEEDNRNFLGSDPVVYYASPDVSFGYRMGDNELITTSRRNELVDREKDLTNESKIMRRRKSLRKSLQAKRAQELRQHQLELEKQGVKVRDAEGKLFPVTLKKKDYMEIAETARERINYQVSQELGEVRAAYNKFRQEGLGTVSHEYHIQMRKPASWQEAAEAAIDEVKELLVKTRYDKEARLEEIEGVASRAGEAARIKDELRRADTVDPAIMKLQELYSSRGEQSESFTLDPFMVREEMMARDGPLNAFILQQTRKNAGAWWREVMERRGFDGISNNNQSDVVVFNPKKSLLSASDERPTVSTSVREVYTNVRHVASPKQAEDVARTLFGETLSLGSKGQETKLQSALVERGFGAIRYPDGRVKVFNPADNVRSTRNDAQGVANTTQYRSDEYQQQILSDLVKGPIPARPADVNWTMRQQILASARRLAELKADRAGSVLRKPAHDLAMVRETLILKIEIDRAMGKSLSPKTNTAVRQLEQLALTAKTPAGRLAEINRMSRTVREIMQGQKVYQRMLEEGDEEFIVQAVSEMYHSEWTDRLFEIWVNNILSGLVTHAINITSTGLNTFMRPVERVMQSIAATTRFDFQEAHATMTEAKAMMVSIPETIKDAIKLIRNKERSVMEMLPPELRQQHELYYLRNNPAWSAEGFNKGGMVGSALDFVGKFVRFPGEMLLKEDMVFKMLNYRMSINAEAARKAITQGKSHADAKALYRLIRDNPTEQMRNQGVDQAAYYTFTKELSGNFKKMQQLRNGVPGARWILPFFQTPTNLVTVGIRHSVFGNVWKDVIPAIKDPTAVGDLARAKVALGTMVPVMLISEMGENITGPINTETPIGRFRAQMGQMPYSIRLGGTWYSYEGLEPLRTILGMAADFRDSIDNLDMEESGAEEMVMQLGLAFASPFVKVAGDNYLLPQLKQVFYMLEVLRSGDPEDVDQSYTARFATRLATSMMVPSLISQLNQRGGFLEGTPLQGLYDPTFKDAEGVIQSIQSRIPGLSQSVPAHIDLWGNPQVMPNGFGPDLISAVPSVDVTQDEVDRMILNLAKAVPDFNFPHRKKTILGVDLNPVQRETFGILAGKGIPSMGLPPLKDVVRQFMVEPQFAALPAAGQAALIEYQIRQRRNIISNYMVQTDEDLQQKVMAQRQQQAIERGFAQ